MNNSIVRRILTGTLLFSFLLLALACEVKQEGETASLRIVLENPGSASRSIAPSVPLTIDYYTISGSGPNGGTFSVSTTNSSTTVPGLETGSWTLTAIAWSSDNIKLITGVTDYTLSPDSTASTITLNEFYGTGTLSVIINWDDEKTFTPAFQLYLTPVGGTESEVTPVVGTGTASYESSLSSGSYTLRGVLYSEGAPKAGFLETIRIVDAQTTEGTIQINLDTLVSTFTTTLSHSYTDSVTGTIEGIPTEPIEGAPITVTFTPTNVAAEDLDSLTVDWYLDGLFLQSGLSIVITPTAGTHRLDAAVGTDMDGSNGSATHSFTAAAVAENAPFTLAAAAVLADNTDGALLDGAEHIITLPDGLILVASRIDDVIQAYREEGGVLVLKQTLTSDSILLPLNGVQFLTASADGTLICALSDYSKSMVIFDHELNSDLITVSEIFQDPFVIDSVSNTVGLLSSAAIDSIGNNIYVTDRFIPQIYHFYYDETGVIPIDIYPITTDPSFSYPKSIEISPDGTKMVSAAYDSSSLFFFDIDPVTGVVTVNTQLSYSTTGTIGIGSINYAVFIDDSTVLATSNDYLCEFVYDNTPGSWHQSWRISEGPLATVMSGPKYVLLDAAKERVFVSDSVSDGIAYFSRDTTEGTLTYVDFISMTPADPVMAVLTADESYLVMPSSVSDEVHLLTVVP